MKLYLILSLLKLSYLSIIQNYETLEQLIQIHNNIISSMAQKMENYYNEKCNDDVR